MNTDKKIKVYAGQETNRKWQEICARYSGNTTAFAAMVEHFHSQMEVEMSESVRVRDLGDQGDIYAALGGDGKWYLGRFSLKTGQISNGRASARGHSANAVLYAGYDTPYDSLDDARAAAQDM